MAKWEITELSPLSHPHTHNGNKEIRLWMRWDRSNDIITVFLVVHRGRRSLPFHFFPSVWSVVAIVFMLFPCANGRGSVVRDSLSITGKNPSDLSLWFIWNGYIVNCDIVPFNIVKISPMKKCKRHCMTVSLYLSTGWERPFCESIHWSRELGMFPILTLAHTLRHRRRSRIRRFIMLAPRNDANAI